MSWPQTINGNTYTEADFIGPNRPYLTNFPAIIGDVATVAGEVQINSDAAVAAAASTGASGTSTTSLAIGTGSKSLTIQTGKSFVAGQIIKVAVTASPTVNYMTGTVTSYNSGTGALVFVSEVVYGSGTYAAWSISVTSDAVYVQNETSRIHNTVSVNRDYVVGYIDFDTTLTNLAIRSNVGTGTIEAYLSSDETSASGTLITGGTFSVSTTVDSNALTAANVVTAASPKYLVLKCTASTSMQDVTVALEYTYSAKAIDALPSGATGTTLALSGNCTIGGATTAAAITMSGDLTLNEPTPRIITIDSDGTLDNKRVDFRNIDGDLLIQVINDANTLATNAIQILRTGNVVDEIQFDATTVDLNGTLDVSGACTIGGALTANGDITLSEPTPRFIIRDSDYVTVDDNRWDINNSNGEFSIQALNDAATISTDVFRAFRTGTTIDLTRISGGSEIELNATLIDINGTVDISGACTLGGALHGASLKSGISQAAAGAAANEIWVDTSAGNVLKRGV